MGEKEREREREEGEKLNGKEKQDEYSIVYYLSAVGVFPLLPTSLQYNQTIQEKKKETDEITVIKEVLHGHTIFH